MNFVFQRRLWLSLIGLLLVSGAFAQDVYTSSGSRDNSGSRTKKTEGFDPQRLIVGGGFNLGLADGLFSIGASPIVGYRITDNFAAGVGLGFLYYSFKDYYFYNVNGNDEYYPLRATLYYPSIWTRYVVYRDFFVQAEGEFDLQQISEYKLDVNGYPEKQKNSYASPALLLGAGLRQPVSDRASLVLMAMYDVIQDKYSPYRNRIDFRIGFNVGF
jgi:hypothetical protein